MNPTRTGLSSVKASAVTTIRCSAWPSQLTRLFSVAGAAQAPKTLVTVRARHPSRCLEPQIPAGRAVRRVAESCAIDRQRVGRQQTEPRGTVVAERGFAKLDMDFRAELLDLPYDRRSNRATAAAAARQGGGPCEVYTG
jgi:hypothetical protein